MNFKNKTVYLLLLLVFVSLSVFSQNIKKFNDNWHFVISDSKFENLPIESNWKLVSLPHTPLVESKVMTGQWQGICWYKKTFTLGEEAKNKKLIFHFEGAMHASEYWINGQKVASHLGGFLPVVFDFTELANIEGENEIIVRLDNNDNELTGPKPMENLDFNMFGGLYREAHIEIKNPLHISDAILANKIAGGGIFVTYPKVSKELAIIEVKTNVNNQYKKNKNFNIVHEIWKGDKLVLSKTSEKISISKNSDLDNITKLNLDNPNLWSPDNPNLYSLKTKIISKDKVVDQVETRIGVREIKITKDAFLVNGEEKFLRGINRHQEYPYVGYALSNKAQYRDAVKIKEAGFDYIRLSHYPQSNAFMDACDELGLVVIDAILGWQYYSDNPEFEAHQYKSSRNLIRRDRNHPSVIAWELSLNESNMSKSFIDSLVSIGHEEYPNEQCYVAGWMEYGYDIYLQARQHRLDHSEEINKPYVVSEYGDWEYYAMNAGLNQDTWGDLLQEDRSSRQLLSDGEVRLLQQASNIQEAHNDNFNTPAFADGYWVMFDYNRGYSNDLESSGIMSIDRLPKFSYYFYQSQRDASIKSDLFKSGPMVKIASWWTKDSPLDLRVYSNCDEVELFLNGKSLGKQKPDDNSISSNLSHPPFTFNIKEFEAGELIAKAFLNGEEATSEVVRTPKEASEIVVELDKSCRTEEANCNDILFVYAKVLDENGTVVPVNNIEVKFEIEGNAELISPEVILTESGIASALIRVGSSMDSIVIKATQSKLLASKKLDVKSQL